MGMMNDYEITEIDTELNIQKLGFYANYLTKSLPIVIRNDAKNWPLYEKLNEWNLKDRNKQDKELNKTFTGRYNGPLLFGSLKDMPLQHILEIN